MDLKSSPVSKCLDKKLLIFGFEIPDLLVVFLLFSILNFLFGQTDQKILLIWLPALMLALVIRLGKRGKPDNFLVHWLRFQFKPGFYSAFSDVSNENPPPMLGKENA